MDVNDLLLDLYGRITEHVHGVLDGLDPALLLVAPEPGTNPIGWLVWHLSRVGDLHLAEILETDQLWVTGDWAPRFGLTPEPYNIGFGHQPDDVAAVRPESIAALREYYDAVDERARSVLEAATPDGLDRIVDRRWDPPVSLGVRLVSIADDSIQHAGQALYLRGLLERR